MATRWEARIEGRIDSLRSDLGDLISRFDDHVDVSESHRRSWMQHKGTLFGAMGPVIVGVIEAVRYFL